MPRRLSARPTASHTRTPEGTGIIASQHVGHTLQRAAVEAGADTHAIVASDLDLYRLRSGWDRRCSLIDSRL